MADRQPSVKQLTQDKNHLISTWVNAIKNPKLETFQNTIENNHYILTISGVFLSVIFISLIIFRSGNFHPYPYPLFNFVILFFIILLSYFVLNLLIFILILALGGSGNYFKQCQMLSILITPLSFLLFIFTFVYSLSGLTGENILNPFTLEGLTGGFLVIFSVYALFIITLGLQAVHQTKATSALYALLMLALIGACVAITRMFVKQQDTLITQIGFFMIQQWKGGYLQEALLGHFWLVFFSVTIAIVIGVICGVLITFPVHRPEKKHLFLLIPLCIFLLLWVASSGFLGNEISSYIETTVRSWERILKRNDGFFGELLTIFGAILRKPAALGMIGSSLIVMFYLLYIVGEKASQVTLYLAGIILTIPSIALFGVLIKPLGIGVFNAAFALILYAQLPILRNTYTGIKEIQPEIIEAGKGMGMTEFQLLMNVKLPLAIPVIMTGVRVSTVMLVGIAAIAAYIGTNTMGDYIFAGIQRAQEIRYITGAIVVAILAIAADILLGIGQEQLTPIEYKTRRTTR